MKRILIFEYASSGLARASSLLTEGFAMLNFAIQEAKEANFEAVTILDPRIAKLELIEVGFRDFKAALKEVDGVLVIAPETDLILYKLAREVEKARLPLLGCTSKGIYIAGDKSKTQELLRSKDIFTPDSQKIAFESKREIGIEYPFVIKPLDGVGGSGTSIVRKEAEVKAAISKVKLETKLKYFLAEEYIKGKHASASVICNSNNGVVLTLNSQKIVENEGLKYFGNSAPLHHPLEQMAKEAARKAVLSIPGLRGYAGVDMVLTKDKVYIVEINPRLTTSCLIAGKVAGINIVKAISEAVLEGKLPEGIMGKGFAAIERIITPRRIFITEELAKAIWSLKGVVSPPLAINEYLNEGETLAFISSHSRDEKRVSAALAAAKKEIYHILKEERCFES
ncbi:MAG: ATP-grasp domain-containing protein [Halobacteria archaeon]